MNVVLLGAPGVGKGTQADLLSRRHGWLHLATGDLLRTAVANETALGRKAREAMSRGDLVEDEVILGLIEEQLGREVRSGVVLDGFPRTLAQAEGLDALLERRAQQVDRVVLLSAPEEEVAKRMAGRGRADDSPETIRHRLRVYERSTKPLVDYYEPRSIVRRVNGVGGIQEIHGRIEAAIEN